MLKKLLTRLVPLAVIASFALGACNTMRGLGQDTERAGEKIQEKSERAR